MAVAPVVDGEVGSERGFTDGEIKKNSLDGEKSADSFLDCAKNGKNTQREDSAPSELERCRAILEKNPHDFSAWEYLLKIVEAAHAESTTKSSGEAVQNLRKAYDAMLERYPLCFGYWNKYADHENGISGPEKAEIIYERGLKAIPNSTYLWERYLQFKMDKCNNQEILRGLFERASECVGYDFVAGHNFWDKYLEYETSKDNHTNVLKILSKVMTIPLHQYARFFERYTSFMATRPLEELAPSDVLEKIEKDIKAQDALKGTDASIRKTPEELQAEIRKHIYNMKYEIYLKTQEAVNKRWPYESEIKRTYFHVNPLDENQLSACRAYLDFEESEGDPQRIKILYERCLVVCALYEEFWLRYVKYLLRNGKEKEARENLDKACNIFVPPSKPSVRLFYAMLEEESGNIDAARLCYEKALEQAPGHIEAVMEYAHFERRQQNITKAKEVIANAIKLADAKIAPFFKIQNEKFAYFEHNDCQKLLDSYRRICEEAPSCKFSHITYFLYALNFQNDTQAVAKSAWELVAKNTSLPSQIKKDIALKYRDFLLDNAASAKDIMEVEKQIPCCLTVCDFSTQTRKRPAEETVNLRATKQQRTTTPCAPVQQNQQNTDQYHQITPQMHNHYATGYGMAQSTVYNNYYDETQAGNTANATSQAVSMQTTAWANYQR